MILIGSRALALRAPQLLNRKCVDFDWICTRAEFDQWMENHSHKVNPTKVYPLPEYHKMIVEGSTNCEFEIVEPGTSGQLLSDLVYQDKDSLETPFGFIPTLDLLFTIKDSHKYKKFNMSAQGFWKTAMDWHMMNRAGAKVRPEYQEFHKLRSKETYNYAHPKLNVSKEDFFKDDGIQYKYDHDTLHQAVALYDKPAYLYYLKNGEDVKSDKEKFFKCPRHIQLAGVIEESCVLSAERSLISNPGVWTPEYAWRFALAKVSSSITSGFFRKFAFENLPEVLKLYPSDYWDKVQRGIETGLVKPFNGSKL